MVLVFYITAKKFFLQIYRLIVWWNRMLPGLFSRHYLKQYFQWLLNEWVNEWMHTWVNNVTRVTEKLENLILVGDDTEERANSVCNHWGNYCNSPIDLERWLISKQNNNINANIFQNKRYHHSSYCKYTINLKILLLISWHWK